MSQQPAQYGYGAAPVQRPTETMAILAIIFAFVFSPLGIVFGVIGRKNIARNGNSGRGLATAGMWLGTAFTAFAIIGYIGIFALAASMQTAP
ncbi:DUF4190 domain-containing protein [Quadrisphaera setariae]|uniref:DUF4190 domain-containing protein n=1 Tax=Quadrisphaera setariae TaxID=2593304 RepID=A0A5C8ZI43_9ACTN|nr:DUF4190 domain-containing protein [Quadrisphaera setariae]TXR56819.1 DUF4190 domain-containing protein [Quadrisphaera setariae]